MGDVVDFKKAKDNSQRKKMRIRNVCLKTNV